LETLFVRTEGVVSEGVFFLNVQAFCKCREITDDILVFRKLCNEFCKRIYSLGYVQTGASTYRTVRFILSVHLLPDFVRGEANI